MNLRLLLVHPGASWSTHDVFCGLEYGLKHHGATVIPYRLDTRVIASKKSLWALWRMKKKYDAALPKPNNADVWYDAGCRVLEMALREQVHVVLIVSAMYLHPDIILLMKRAGLRVAVLFTESPYDHDKELAIAKLVDGCWTNERSVVADFAAVNPCAGYLPHAWHPEKHYVGARMMGDVPSHDVVFVGSGFSERIKFFNAIDWSGIDLGLYGTWGKALGLKPQVQAMVRGGVNGQAQIDNELAGALYRRAKVGLNLYRTSMGWGKNAPQIAHAESLSPRAYELAACGAFHISDDRKEVREVFGELIPTFKTPSEAAALIRTWLADARGRAQIAEQLPAAVAASSWVNRAATVIGDVSQLLGRAAA